MHIFSLHYKQDISCAANIHNIVRSSLDSNFSENIHMVLEIQMALDGLSIIEGFSNDELLYMLTILCTE